MARKPVTVVVRVRGDAVEVFAPDTDTAARVERLLKELGVEILAKAEAPRCG